MISISLFILFFVTTVLFQNCGGITVSPTGTNASGNNGGGTATDPCEGLDIGDEISSEVLCGGTFRNSKYMIMPSGCPDNTNNPTCSGATDTLTKFWNDGTLNLSNIPEITNVVDYPDSSIELGDENTEAIINITSPSLGGIHQAAKFCADMVFGGYDDWYLPSKSELTYLFCNSNHSQNAIGQNRPYEEPDCGGDFGLSQNLSGFAENRYWSSTEAIGTGGDTAGSAWYHDFLPGGEFRAAKYYSYHVRCIRKY